MPFNLASSQAIAAKAGITANSKITGSGSLMAQYSQEAEQFINLYTRYNFTSKAAVLYASASAALQDAASCLAAIKVINHNITAYQTGEAETMANLLNYQAFRILDLIKEDTARKFVIDGSTGVS